MHLHRKFARGVLKVEGLKTASFVRAVGPKGVRFSDICRDELDSHSNESLGPTQIVCAFEGDVPPISREQAERLTSESRRLARMLTDAEVQSILRAEEAEDGHR